MLSISTLLLLSSLTRKFGVSAFYTIYQDYASHELNLSLTESATGGTIYGAMAIFAVAFISVTSSFGWSYNKILALIMCAIFQGIVILLVTTSGTKVFYLLPIHCAF